jgi:hypothetical protein
MLPLTQLLLSFGLAAEIWALDNWYLMGGGGIGYLY